MRAQEAAAFRDLNFAWIAEFFTMEAPDRAVLEHPQAAIVDRGGAVLMARRGALGASSTADPATNTESIGCVALVKKAEGVYELAKMAVTPAAQGQGVGAALMEAAIARARALGARKVLIETSSKLPNAIRLYERFGFRHLKGAECAPSPYTRCDVQMQLDVSA